MKRLLLAALKAPRKREQEKAFSSVTASVAFVKKYLMIISHFALCVFHLMSGFASVLQHVATASHGAQRKKLHVNKV